MTVPVAPLVVAIVGLLTWFIASIPREKSHPMRPWFAELGRLVFFIGFLVLIAAMGATAWRFTLG